MVLPFRESSDSPTLSSTNLCDSSSANLLLRRVLNKLQILVLDNPYAAVHVLSALDRWLGD